MKWRSMVLWALQGAGVASLAAQAPDSGRAARLRRDFPCPSSLRGRIVSDSASRGEACHVVAAALREVGQGAAQGFGVAPAETAHVAGAFVDYRAFQALDAQGRRDSANDDVHWFVELIFERTHTRVFAWVDARSSRIMLRRGVAEFGEPRKLPWIH